MGKHKTHFVPVSNKTPPFNTVIFPHQQDLFHHPFRHLEVSTSSIQESPRRLTEQSYPQTLGATHHLLCETTPKTTNTQNLPT